MRLASIERSARGSRSDEFYTARFATVVIHQAEDHVEFTAYLEDGMTFPRKFEGAPAEIGGLGTGQFRSCSFTRRSRKTPSSWICGSCAASIRAPRNPRKSASSTSHYSAGTETTFLNSIASALKSRKLWSFLIRRAAMGYVLELEPGVRPLPAKNPSSVYIR